MVTVNTRKMSRRKMEMVREMVSRARAILHRQEWDDAVVEEGEDDDDEEGEVVEGEEEEDVLMV